MSVIIKKSRGSWLWTCQVRVDKKGVGKFEACGHSDLVSSETAAREAYVEHKRVTRGH